MNDIIKMILWSAETRWIDLCSISNIAVTDKAVIVLLESNWQLSSNF